MELREASQGDALLAAIPHLLTREGSSIVNVASLAGLLGQPYSAAYAASKAGVVNLTRGKLSLKKALRVQRKQGNRWVNVMIRGLTLRSSCRKRAPVCVTVGRGRTQDFAPWLGTYGDARCDCEKCVSVKPGNSESLGACQMHTDYQEVPLWIEWGHRGWGPRGAARFPGQVRDQNPTPR